MISSVNQYGTGSLWDMGKKDGKSNKARLAAGSVIKDQFASALQNINFQNLASRFHSTHMDQKEYDDFLDALVEQNIITAEDKRYVGYHGIVESDHELGVVYSRYSPDPEAVNYREGDMLAYVKYQSQIIYEPPTEASERSKSLYRKIAAIMEQMGRSR